MPELFQGNVGKIALACQESWNKAEPWPSLSPPQISLKSQNWDLIHREEGPDFPHFSLLPRFFSRAGFPSPVGMIPAPNPSIFHPKIPAGILAVTAGDTPGSVPSQHHRAAGNHNSHIPRNWGLESPDPCPELSLALLCPAGERFKLSLEPELNPCIPILLFFPWFFPLLILRKGKFTAAAPSEPLSKYQMYLWPFHK